MAAWIQTYTGKQVYPLQSDARVVEVLDIAHSLAHVCRFNGHCAAFYSVAEHSVRGSYVIDQFTAERPEVERRALALRFLLHDASEVYLSDLPAPLKRLPEFAWYLKLEAEWSRTIRAALGLPQTDDPPEVREVDLIMLATEKRELLGEAPASWGMLPDPIPGPQFMGWAPEYAEARFMARWQELAP